MPIDPEARFKALMRAVRQRGFRMTPQRLALLRLLAESPDHPSAAHLYDALRAQFPTTSFATVYKTLSLLEEMGEVLEMSFSDDDRRYDGRRPDPHPHLICVRCRRIVDLEGEIAQSLIYRAAQQMGYRLIGHRVDIFGLCPACQATEPAADPWPSVIEKLI